MKTSLLALALLTCAPAFAADNMICTAEDGSEVRAQFDDSEGLVDIKIKVRSGKLQAIPGARSALFTFKDVHKDLSIASLVIADAAGNILVAIASDVYVDRTGSYFVQKCEVSL